MIPKPLPFIIITFTLLLLSSCGAEPPADLPQATLSAVPQTSTPDLPAANSIPKFVKVNYIDLDQIQTISLFRSSVGHDYSDSVETCRSMKHYFIPDVDLDWSSIPIYSPVNGEILKITEEWAGTQIQIQPDGYPEYFIVIFHVDLTPGLEEGQTLSAGEFLGTHISDQTNSDIAVGVNSQDGFRWISYFEVMSEEIFAEYQHRGVPDRGALIISRVERDTNPLSCEGEMFVGPGPLENYFELEEK